MDNITFNRCLNGSPFIFLGKSLDSVSSLEDVLNIDTTGINS